MKQTHPLVAGMLGFALLLSGCNQGAATEREPSGSDVNYSARSTSDSLHQVRLTGRNNNAVNPGVADRHTDRFIGRVTKSNPRNANMNRGDNAGPAATVQPYGLLNLSRAELNQLANNPVRIDRGRLARAVAQAISPFREISDATILVTDDHVFIGYNQSSDAGRTQTGRLEDRMRQAAESVVPGYYQVYVSRDRTLTDRVLRLLDGDRPDVDRELDRILRDRKK